MPVIWSYIIIPAFELFIKPDNTNLDAAEEEMVKKDPVYDYLLYLVPVFLYASLIIYFSFFIKATGFTRYRLCWPHYADGFALWNIRN